MDYFFAGIYAVAVREEEEQNIELGACKRKFFALEITLLVVAVDSEVAESDVLLIDRFLLDDI